jgi:hypothetical protein
VHVHGAQRLHLLGLARLGVVDRAVGHEPRPRELGHHPVALGDAVHGLGDHLADHLGGEVPLREDVAHLLLAPLGRDDEHALLRLREQDLVRRHPRLADRHLAHVDRDAHVPARRHLGGRRGEAGGAHVLDRHDRAAADQLQARLEEELLGERVAHLHARALRLARLAQVLGGERRAVDPVPPRARADGEDRVADALRDRAHQLVLLHEADAHRVDERVALVRVVEHHLARHGGHAHAVAVVADALHHAGEEVAHARRVERSEAERVEHRDRARAHREHVAQDAAHAGGGALVGLDRRRVVVRLDLECHREPVADRDHPRVLPGPLQHVGALGGRVRSTGLECLYEQCSFQSALTTPSSVKVASRPSIATSRSYSSGVSPCSATSAGVTAGSPGRGRTVTVRRL